MDLEPINDCVVVKPINKDGQNKDGFVRKGTVIMRGDGKLLDNGQRSYMQVKRNDIILFINRIKCNFHEFDEFIFIQESDVLAKIVE